MPETRVEPRIAAGGTNMPIYEYEPDAEGCDKCSGRFEVIQRLADPPLTHCPECGRPCHRVLSAFSVTQGSAARLAQRTWKSTVLLSTARPAAATTRRFAARGPAPSRSDSGGFFVAAILCVASGGAVNYNGDQECGKIGDWLRAVLKEGHEINALQGARRHFSPCRIEFEESRNRVER